MSSMQRHNRVANSSFTAPSGIQYQGLWNRGSTCYLNSVLQVLFMTKDFREAVERHTCDNPKCMDCGLKSLFEDLNEDTAYTYKITKRLGINDVREQRDAAEYFEKILSLTSDKASQIFHGELTHETKCCKGHTTNADGSFWHLPLDLVDSHSKVYKVVSGTKKFFEESYFTGENQMYCDDCDTKCDASMKCVIKHHPDVLTLLLKRFDFDYQYMTYVKNNSPVDVPHTLEISKGQTYELYAVVDHCGELRSGHYTVTIKSQDDERWYKFNDETVRLADYQPFQRKDTKTAYLLFYRKQKCVATMPVITNHDDRCQDPERMSEREKGKKTRGEGYEAISNRNEQTSDKHRTKPKLKREYEEKEFYGTNENKRLHSTEIQHEEQCDIMRQKEQKRGDDEPAPRRRSSGRGQRSSQDVEYHHVDLPAIQKRPQQRPGQEISKTHRKNADVDVVEDVRGRQNKGHAQDVESQHSSYREAGLGRGRSTEKERGSHVENTRLIQKVHSPTKTSTGPERVTVEGVKRSQRHSDTKNKIRETADKQSHSRRSTERKSGDEIVTLMKDVDSVTHNESLPPSPEFESRGEYEMKERVSHEKKNTWMCPFVYVCVPGKKRQKKIKTEQNF